MAVPDTTRQAASNAVAALGRWISVHTATAGVGGGNEAAGGAYQRVATVWAPGLPGINLGSDVLISVPNGSYVEGGVWASQTSTLVTDFVGSGPFSGGTIVVSGTGATITVRPTVQIA